MQFSFHNMDIHVTHATRVALQGEINRRFKAREGFALATVNVDHLVKMHASPAYTASYAEHDLVVADGWPIVLLSKLAKQPVDLMPGSDTLVPLCEWAAEAGVNVGLLGSTDDTLEAAKGVLMQAVPNLKIAFMHAPPMGFDPQGEEALALLHRLEAAKVSLCLLALGAPKQEMLAARGRQVVPGVGFASIGAGLDFLSGRQRRAPAVMRRLRLEWLWRAVSSPRRLIPRYAQCFAILPRQAWRAWRLGKSG